MRKRDTKSTKKGTKTTKEKAFRIGRRGACLAQVRILDLHFVFFVHLFVFFV